MRAKLFESCFYATVGCLLFLQRGFPGPFDGDLREEREGRSERARQEEVDAIRKGVRGEMAKKVKRSEKKPSLADDIMASWEEALKYARGEKTNAIVHHRHAERYRRARGAAQARPVAARVRRRDWHRRRHRAQAGTRHAPAVGRRAHADRGDQARAESGAPRAQKRARVVTRPHPEERRVAVRHRKSAIADLRT